MGRPDKAPRAAAPDAAEPESEAALEAARRLFAQDCVFVTGAADRAGLPDGALPEVAFAGRSNVGKSSLINALTGRSALARTSNAPGRTRQINFFRLSGRLMLVDLPGYGYAKASKTLARAWSKLAQAYLKGRPSLRRACLLIDARRGIMDSDRAVMRVLDDSAVSFVVVLTKADKVKPGALARRAAEIETALKSHAAAYPTVLATSARSGAGIAALRAHLGALAAPA